MLLICIKEAPASMFRTSLPTCGMDSRRTCQRVSFDCSKTLFRARPLDLLGHCRNLTFEIWNYFASFLNTRLMQLLLCLSAESWGHRDRTRKSKHILEFPMFLGTMNRFGTSLLSVKLRDGRFSRCRFGQL